MAGDTVSFQSNTEIMNFEKQLRLSMHYHTKNKGSFRRG